MSKPHSPIPLLVAGIVSSGIGFMLLGIWISDKIPRNDMLLIGMGIALSLLAVSTAILHHEITRRQSVFDSGNTTPSKGY
ncbi:MAG: hypothetical protein AB1299_09000 [Thermoproteota archaeon]